MYFPIGFVNALRGKTLSILSPDEMDIFRRGVRYQGQVLTIRAKF